jgi:hypothetical protein
MCFLMRKAFIFTIVVCLFSCNSNDENTGTLRLDLGVFSLEVPKSWKYIHERGADSYVGRIAIDEVDTLSFDLGWYSNKLNDDEPVPMDSSFLRKLDPKYADTSMATSVNSVPLDDRDKHRINNIRWDSIDHRLAKIVFPINPGRGTTGIYIDSLWVSGSDVDRFNFYGINLRPENEAAVLKAIKTLKFTKS